MASMKLQTQLIRETDDVSEYIVHVDDDYIETFVTHSAQKAEEWIKATEERNHLRLHRLISVLDVKWNPSIVPGQESPVAVLQLLVNTRCLMYRITQNQESRIPDGMKQFLQNPNNTFVGVGIENHKRKLGNEFSVQVVNAVDVREWAGRELEDRDLDRFTLQQLGTRFLGKYVDGQRLMFVRMSDWENDGNRLTDEQVQYASVEAYVSFSIARMLQSWYD